MNNLRYISLTTLLLVLTRFIFGQQAEILNTVDLIRISEKFGLDSALTASKGFPIYEIDSAVSKELIRHSLVNNPSELIDEFITKYTFHTKDREIGEILYKYYATEEHIQKIRTTIFKVIVPIIDYYAFYAMSENPIDQTESFFIDQYEYWNSQVDRFKRRYERSEKYHSEHRDNKLQEPFLRSNQNCHTILSALEKMKSQYFDSTKLAIHKDYLICQFLPPQYSVNNYDTTDYEIITLENGYSDIGKIKFEIEPNIRIYFSLDSSNQCWNYILYNKNIGFLDTGCQWSGLSGSGIKYKIELIDKNKIKLMVIYGWES